jgi:hypothetical protein
MTKSLRDLHAVEKRSATTSPCFDTLDSRIWFAIGGSGARTRRDRFCAMADEIRTTRRDLALWGAGALLLTAALVRLAVPDRARIRPVSIEAIDIASEPIGQGATIERQATWNPPDDVYLLGWNYDLKTGAAPTLRLLHGNTRLFMVGGAAGTADHALFPSGTAYRVRKGEALTLVFRVTNGGPPGETHGASVLLYFVPMAGN